MLSVVLKARCREWGCGGVGSYDEPSMGLKVDF